MVAGLANLRDATGVFLLLYDAFRLSESSASSLPWRAADGDLLNISVMRSFRLLLLDL